MQITKENFDFLKSLKNNNNRDWFTDNKPTYQEQHENIISFADELLAKLNEHDTIETPTGKKACFASTETFVFQKISHHIKHIGVVVLSELQSCYAEVTTFT